MLVRVGDVICVCVVVVTLEMCARLLARQYRRVLCLRWILYHTVSISSLSVQYGKKSTFHHVLSLSGGRRRTNEKKDERSTHKHSEIDSWQTGSEI